MRVEIDVEPLLTCAPSDTEPLPFAKANGNTDAGSCWIRLNDRSLPSRHDGGGGHAVQPAKPVGTVAVGAAGNRENRRRLGAEIWVSCDVLATFDRFCR